MNRQLSYIGRRVACFILRHDFQDQYYLELDGPRRTRAERFCYRCRQWYRWRLPRPRH